jgi:hypothetical protein
VPLAAERQSLGGRVNGVLISARTSGSGAGASSRRWYGRNRERSDQRSQGNEGREPERPTARSRRETHSRVLSLVCRLLDLEPCVTDVGEPLPWILFERPPQQALGPRVACRVADPSSPATYSGHDRGPRRRCRQRTHGGPSAFPGARHRTPRYPRAGPPVFHAPAPVT